MAPASCLFVIFLINVSYLRHSLKYFYDRTYKRDEKTVIKELDKIKIDHPNFYRKWAITFSKFGVGVFFFIFMLTTSITVNATYVFAKGQVANEILTFIQWTLSVFNLGWFGVVIPISISKLVRVIGLRPYWQTTLLSVLTFFTAVLVPLAVVVLGDPLCLYGFITRNFIEDKTLNDAKYVILTFECGNFDTNSNTSVYCAKPVQTIVSQTYKPAFIYSNQVSSYKFWNLLIIIINSIADFFYCML